jgi:hypothetical protein
MADVIRRNRGTEIPATVTLATADDLDGTVDGSQYLTVPRGARVIILQVSNGTLGTAGIDVIEVSQGGGAFYADPTLILASGADQGGALIANGALNAAGVEPVTPNNGAAVWKSGPFAQTTVMRCGRKTTTTGGTTWVTGAPSVYAILIKNRR